MDELVTLECGQVFWAWPARQVFRMLSKLCKKMLTKRNIMESLRVQTRTGWDICNGEKLMCNLSIEQRRRLTHSIWSRRVRCRTRNWSTWPGRWWSNRGQPDHRTWSEPRCPGTSWRSEGWSGRRRRPSASDEGPSETFSTKAASIVTFFSTLPKLLVLFSWPSAALQQLLSAVEVN